MSKSLKDLRQSAGLPREKAAYQIGVTDRTLWHWETDPGRVTAKAIFRIAEVYKTTPGKVFEAITSSLERTA